MASPVANDATSGVREGLSSVTRGTLYLLVATLCLVGLTFVSRVIVVRSISTSDWTAYSLGLTLAAVLSAFGSLGVPSALARNLSSTGSDDDRRALVRAGLLVGSLMAAAAAVALFLVGPSIGRALAEPELGVGLEFFSVAVGASIAGSVIASIFQGYEDVTPNALFLQIINPALFVVFLLIAIVVPPFGISYLEALLAYAAASAITLGLLVAYAVVQLPRRLPPGPRSPGALGPLMRFAAPLFVAGIMSSVTGSGDTLVLGAYHASEVGTYSASLTLARLLQIGISALAYIFLPVAAKFLRQGNPTAVALSYATATKWMILFSLPLFLLFFLLPSASLGFVYGPNYALVIVPLQIAVVGAFLTTLMGPATTAQVAYGQTRLLMYNAVAAGLTDLGLAFALVPAYGYAGSAVAWAGANVAYTALSLAELAYLVGLHPFRRTYLVPIVLTAVPVGVVIALVHPRVPGWSLPALWLGIVGLFILVLLLSRSVDEGDRLLLEAVERLVGRPLRLIRRIGRIGLAVRA